MLIGCKQLSDACFPVVSEGLRLKHIDFGQCNTVSDDLLKVIKGKYPKMEIKNYYHELVEL